MHPITQELVQELDILYGLYQLALEVTLSITDDSSEDIVRCLDSRQRLITRTKQTSEKCKRLFRLFLSTTNLPANQHELIAEKKRLVKDELVQLQKAEMTLMRRIHVQMNRLKTDLVVMNKRSQATIAYIQAPRAFAAVA